MSAQTIAANDLECAGCGMTTDLCLSMREDCCNDCTHYPDAVPDPAVDDAAVIRAVEGDVSVPLNSDEVLAVLHELVRKGLNDDEIAERFGGGITGSAVYYWRHRENSRPRPRPAGGWAMSTPTIDTTSTTDALLVRAERHPSKRVQTAARRAQDALQRLRDLLAEDEGKREARERVERLERELREAKAALRGKPIGRPIASGARPQTAPVEGGIPCPRGCGKVSINRAGAASHERFCTHTAAVA